ncbi:MAG: sulfate ABC transporter permease subunit CysT [Planctomycetes bacterium]|nr:sulfate ABC transporter permease subunit CysT [Planctomycetota bacterium]
MARKRKRVMPGFGLTFGCCVLYLGLIVLIPISTIFASSAGMTWENFWATITSRRVMAAYKLSFMASFLAALVNVVFGFIVTWALVRYRFPGRKLIDAMVDLPFALPTAVAGICLATIYARTGWLGGLLEPLGIKVAYNQAGIVIALIFIGLPFVVRTVQPVLEDLGQDVEDAAACLGASRWQTFRRIILPELTPALLAGFALAFARGLGEYGSVIFIAGNIPMKSEIAPLLIITKLEEYNTPGATAIAVVMLAASFIMLFAINTIQRWSSRHMER